MQRYQKDLGLLAFAIVLLATGIYFWFGSTRKPRAVQLRMTAGDASGLRHRLAKEFAHEAEKCGIQISVEATDGSEAALAKLESGVFDIALIQGGLAIDRNSPIRQVTALHIEPLHLLVRPELYESVKEIGLKQLAGRKVNLGAMGSGTHALAAEVLQFTGLIPASQSRGELDPEVAGYLPNSLNYSELMESELADLPDAIFTVSTLPSPIADHLTDRHGFQLVPLMFGEALSLKSFSELGTPHEPGTIDKQHIYSTTIPAFTYSVEPACPPEALSTIGTRLLLVSHERVAAEQVKRLMECLFQSDLIKVERSRPDATVMELVPEFPLHRGAELYRQRNKPIIAGDAIDYLEKVLAIAATVLGGTFFIVQWYLRSSRRSREANFTHYMERVIAIENEAMQNELASQLDLAMLIRLQRELAALKSDAVSKFAAGELEGEGLIHGFLALVNDARNQLTRLILHQRENIEQLAANQNHSVDEVWQEQSKTPHK